MLRPQLLNFISQACECSCSRIHIHVASVCCVGSCMGQGMRKPRYEIITQFIYAQVQLWLEAKRLFFPQMVTRIILNNSNAQTKLPTGKLVLLQETHRRYADPAMTTKIDRTSAHRQTSQTSRSRTISDRPQDDDE